MGIHDQDQDPRNADKRNRSEDSDVEGHLALDPEKIATADTDADDEVEGHRFRVNPDTYGDEGNPTP